MFTLNPRVQGADKELIELFKKVCPSTIGHMQDSGFIRALKPLKEGQKIVGNAITVRIPHLDSCAVHKALDLINPGDVLCIDTNKDYERAPFGEMVCYMARHKQVGGVIIDGCITDYSALIHMGVPVFMRSVSPLTTRIRGIEGEINVIISIDNVVIKPGDLVVADDDGILVLDVANAKELGERAIKAQEREVDLKKQIDSGVNLSKITGADKFFNGEK